MADLIEQLTLTEDDLRRTGSRVLHQFGVLSTYKIHSHDFYELFLVPRGRAIHCVNGRTQLLTTGSFVLIRPGDVHRYDFLNQADFEILDIGIPKSVFERLCAYLNMDRTALDTPALPPHRVLSGSALGDVERMLKRNENPESAENGFRYALSIFPYLFHFFLTDEPPENELPRWLSALLARMDEPENYVAGLPRMLELACMSQEHLTRSFRRYLGVTPTAFINGRRLGMAAELLLSGQTPVIDVGGLCGFNSQSHFYRLFSERFGCPPGAFRETFLRQTETSSFS